MWSRATSPASAISISRRGGRLHDVGVLEAAFAACAAALRPGGLLAFSIERSDAGDVVLDATLRYSHSDDYVDRPYPMLPPRLNPFEPRPAAEEKALADWWTEHHRLNALRDAARAQQERLHAEAAAGHLDTARASLADGLVRALLRPAGTPAVKLQLLIDPSAAGPAPPVTSCCRPAPCNRCCAPCPADTGSRRPGRSARRPDPATTWAAPPARQPRPARAARPSLDGERCRSPGCSHTRFLHAHHLRFWRATAADRPREPRARSAPSTTG